MASNASPMWNGSPMQPGPTGGLVQTGIQAKNPKVGNPHDFRHVAVTPRGAGVHHHRDMPAPTPINLPNQTVGTAIQF